MELTLAEEIFLIGLDDTKGTHSSLLSSYIHFGLVGALLAELAMLQKIGLDEKKRLVVTDPLPPAQDQLNYIYTQFYEVDKPRKAAWWVENLGNKRIYRLVADNLVAHTILVKEEKRYLWVFPYAAYPQQDASAKYWIKQRLRSEVLASAIPGPRDVALLSLIQACSLVPMVFTRDERKAAKKYIKKLVKEEVYGKAVAEVISNIEASSAAAIVAITAATSS